MHLKNPPCDNPWLKSNVYQLATSIVYVPYTIWLDMAQYRGINMAKF